MFLAKLYEEVNPKITQEFVSYINKMAQNGSYRVNVGIRNKNIAIDVYPTVFPPKSDYGISSKSIFEALGNLDGLEVADVGCGSGIETIVALMAGAKYVDAGDINPQAVECSKHNIKVNGMEAGADVFLSDLFLNFPKKKYDLIIANLPIVNYDAGNSLVNQALYDDDFKIHKRLFEEAKDFLSEKGMITFSHANLQSAKTENPNYDFQVLEKLIDEFGYMIVERIETEELGYKWITYKIKLKK